MRRIARCQHVKINGTQCGSPAMRGRRLCYFHLNASSLQTFRMGDPRCITPYTLPLLEDAESIQIALMRVTDLIVKDLLQPKQAGLILYALQTASSNLSRAEFQPRASSVIISKDMPRETPLREDPLDELMYGADDEEEEYEEVEDDQQGDGTDDQEEGESEESDDEPSRVAVKPKLAAGEATRKGEPETVAEWLADIFPAGTKPS